MGLLKDTKCYTIGPLEFGSFDKAISWRQSLKDELCPLGIDILSPLDKVFKNFPKEGRGFNQHLREELKKGNFDYVHTEMKQIRTRDLALCDLSTFLIAYLDINIPTFGSVDEIITSKRNQKPIFLIIDGGYKNIPLWLSSYFKPNWVYNDLDSVVAIIKKINSGEEQINNKYWKILNK